MPSSQVFTFLLLQFSGQQLLWEKPRVQLCVREGTTWEGCTLPAGAPLGTGVPTDSTSAVRWPPPVGLGWAILRAISKCLRQVSTSDPKTAKSPVCIIAKGFHPVPRTLPTSCWNETGSTANLFFFLSFSHLFSDLLHLALFSEHCNLN